MKSSMEGRSRLLIEVTMLKRSALGRWVMSRTRALTALSPGVRRRDRPDRQVRAGVGAIEAS